MPVLLLLPRPPANYRLHHVEDCAFSVRAASAGDPRQRSQSRVSRRSCAPRAPHRLPHFGRLWRTWRGGVAVSHWTGGSRARLLDPFRPVGLHGGTRRVFQLFRPYYRRVRVHSPAGPAAVADPVLAFCAGRDPGGPCRCLAWGHRCAWRGFGAAAVAKGGGAMTALLETRNVSKSYGAFRALEDVSIEVRAGELLSLVGPNGAGKTTLVNLLTGLMAPTTGEVLFMGRSIAGVGPVELADHGLARAFQLIQIFPQLTVAESIGAAVVSRQKKRWRLFSRLAADGTIGARVRDVASIFGL